MIHQDIIDIYYPEGALRDLLLHHSRQVADRALGIARRHPEWQLDLDFVKDAAMLHDIGIYRCDAAGIHCFGDQPYLAHGVIGARIMRAHGYEALARVCERHTGTGLTRTDIAAHGLPVPDYDLVPETLAERLVCYADKFFSKSHPERVRDIAQTAQSLTKFGTESAARFVQWAREFEGYEGHPPLPPC